MTTKTKLSKAEAERIREGSDNPAAVQAKMDAVAGKGKTVKVKSEAVLAAEKLLKEARAADRPMKTAKAKAEPRPVCTGVKANGMACTAKAKTGHDRCVDHLPALLRLTAEEKTALEQVLGGFDDEQLVDFFVTEVGWHRAKAIARECNVITEG